LVYWASGSGIAKDIKILERELTNLGYRVHHIVTRDRRSKQERILRFLLQLPRLLVRRDLQVHVEQIHREQFRFGKKNILLPNPEITDSDLFRKINEHPIVFCKSRRSVQLFKAMGLKTVYTGFTSDDNLNTDHEKDFRRFLHLAGASNFKGTDTVYDVWSKHSSWPRLTIIRTLKDCYGNPRRSLKSTGNIEVIEQWIPSEDLSRHQNMCGIHLCPSEMEGFGHYILEGLSTGSIVVTTNAAPMNELVDETCGYCVDANHKGKSYMEDRWTVDPHALEVCIENIVAMPDSELRKLGDASRARFEKLNNAFPGNLKIALNEV